MTEFFVHETAIVEDDVVVGAGTKIWHHCHVREGAIIGENVNIGKGVYVDVGVIIGNNVRIQNGVSLYKGVKIEDDVSEASVTSAFPLEGKQRDRLSKKLKDVFKRDITIKENVDPKVVAGVVIKMGNLVLDGSLRDKIREKIKNA